MSLEVIGRTRKRKKKKRNRVKSNNKDDKTVVSTSKGNDLHQNINEKYETSHQTLDDLLAVQFGSSYINADNDKEDIWQEVTRNNKNIKEKQHSRGHLLKERRIYAATDDDDNDSNEATHCSTSSKEYYSSEKINGGENSNNIGKELHNNRTDDIFIDNEVSRLTAIADVVDELIGNVRMLLKNGDVNNCKSCGDIDNMITIVRSKILSQCNYLYNDCNTDNFIVSVAAEFCASIVKYLQTQHKQCLQVAKEDHEAYVSELRESHDQAIQTGNLRLFIANTNLATEREERNKIVENAIAEYIKNNTTHDSLNITS